MKPIIIDGHKGVMPLDLSGVEPKYHKIMIAQHKKDIKVKGITKKNQEKPKKKPLFFKGLIKEGE